MPGEKGGVNEGLGEGAHGRVREWGEGWRGGTPGCHGVSGEDGGSRPGDKSWGKATAISFSPVKRGTIRNLRVTVYFEL